MDPSFSLSPPRPPLPAAAGVNRSAPVLPLHSSLSMLTNAVMKCAVASDAAYLFAFDSLLLPFALYFFFFGVVVFLNVEVLIDRRRGALLMMIGP